MTSRILRGSLRTSPGPGGASSILSYTQPCRKIVVNYCDSSVASHGVRGWLLNEKEGGLAKMAAKWPQIEWVVQEGRRGSEPSVTAHYGE